jgi:hypothetical protein
LINKYSSDDAGRIIFFGLTASLLIKFVSLMGPFGLPFLSRRQWCAFGIYWKEFRPAAWVALLYLVVLMLFFIRLQFMNGRYLSFLNLLVVPLFAVALSNFALQFPRLAKGLVVIGLLLMLANVISTGAPKTQYIQAGRWVAEHIDPAASVYYEDGRIAYYAGRGYPPPVLDREAAMAPGVADRYQYFVIDADGDEPWLKDWLNEHHQRVLAHFANRKGKTMLVIGR